MKRFVYKYLDVHDYWDFDRFKNALEEEGYQGWELCGFEYGHAFLKKESAE